jgi:hypothetical protein
MPSVAIHETAGAADDERNRDRRGRGHTGFERQREADARQRQHRADREIDPAGNDHERHPDRNDGVERGLLEDVEKIRDRQEVRSSRPQDQAQREQPRQRSQLPSTVRSERALDAANLRW